ncbi:hypothetical protein EB796_022071 [Bugula neritina]|uniref:Uncharacterized protein n=1 Tax=Bugula neritina TaxID=10212 RepID=A0A7J7J2C3_BUGNE|nr:hypothetical protein EB796_022071 [Bugula neritina]
MENEKTSNKLIGSLASYAMSDSDEELDDMHKISGEISGSDDDHSSHSKAPSRTYSPVIKESDLKRSQGSSLALVDYGEQEEEEEGEGHPLPTPDGNVSEKELSPNPLSQNKGIVDYERTLTGEEISAVANDEPVSAQQSDEEDLIPPSPPGSPRELLCIQKSKDFRNPSIYEKLLSHIGINDKGTNYPPELYDPSIWTKSSQYDELAKLQNAEMEKRKSEKKEKSKVEFVTSTKSAASSDTTEGAGAKRTKWDNAGQQAAIPPVGSLIKKK